MILAAIDIGTNSTLLTIVTTAAVQPPRFDVVFDVAEITRLGEGLNKNGSFDRRAVERTIKVLRMYKDKCDELGAEKIAVVGTAATRRAKNAGEFIKSVKAECGFDIEVISGEREAELVLRSVEHDFGEDVVVVDIGGGSTEMITGLLRSARNDDGIVSLPIGSVVLTEKCIHTDPVSDGEFNDINKAVAAQLKSLKLKAYGLQLIATAGTATTLAAMKLELKEYSHSEVHGSLLTVDDIEKTIHTLRVCTVEERKKLPGLEPKRADVILAGAVILKMVMGKLGYNEVTVSDRGVRWGLIYERISGD